MTSSTYADIPIILFDYQSYGSLYTCSGRDPTLPKAVEVKRAD